MTSTTVSLVQNLCKLSHNVFSTFILKNGSKSNNILNEKNVLELKKIFSHLNLNDIYYDLNELSIKNNDDAPITFTSIFQDQFFSLTIFGFRHKTSYIPLHDHPYMHGFIKCIHGSILIKSYTKIIDNIDLKIPNEILNKVDKSEQHCIVPCIYNGEDIINNDDFKIGTLTPIVRNIHEIRPLTNTAIMADIISPPYTEYTDSYFYKVIDTTYDKCLNKNITWLLRTIENNDYYCDTLSYHGPNINIV